MKHSKLLLIVVVGAILRLMWLSSVPAGFTPDEASFGYDAHSLLVTGRDQWGASFPLVLKSFGDGKMPLYSYITIPFVYVLGLSEFSVRLPNAIFGTLAIVATYLLCRELYKDKKIAILASLLLAISPWHIPLSRGAFEANLTTLLLPLAITFLLRGKRQTKYLYLSALFVTLNMFTYHSARIITPLVVILAFYFDRQEYFKSKSKMIMPSLVFLLIFVVTGFTYVLGAGTRLASSSILNSAQVAGDISYTSAQVGVPHNLARVFHNKVFYSGSLFIKNYLQYFSPEFLFTEGAAEGTYGMVPGIGTFFLFEALTLGAFVVAWSRKDIKINKIILIWMLLAPIPAALSIGPGRAANRAMIAVPVMQILSACGAVYLFNVAIKTKIKKTIVYVMFAIVTSVSLIGFVENYVVLQKYSFSADMVWGASDVFKYLSPREELYAQIVVTKKISEPHIFAAFYSKMSPLEYQRNAQLWNFEAQGFAWVDQMQNYRLGKYVFKNIDWVADLQLPNTLIVAAPQEVPDGTNAIKTVYYPNGKIAYLIIDTNVSGYAYMYENK